MECKAQSNRTACACKHKDCERNGLCCECLRYHLGARSLPACVKKLDWVKVTPPAA